MMASEGETLYYITDYSDEHMPCAPRPEAWAAWLAEDRTDWGRGGVTADGAEFDASVMRIEADIVATRQPDGSWSFSRAAAGADFLAVRFFEHGGWDADNILWGDDMDAALRDWFADEDNAGQLDDVEYIAVGTNLPDVVMTFRAGPPATMEVREKVSVH